MASWRSATVLRARSQSVCVANGIFKISRAGAASSSSVTTESDAQKSVDDIGEKAVKKVKYGVQGTAHMIPAYGVPVMKRPMTVKLEAGKTYYWCMCGHSDKQPFCDGSHKREGWSSFRPVPYIPEKDMEAVWCMCKITQNRPFCDGNHKNLRPGLVQDTKLLRAYQGTMNIPGGVAKKLGLRCREGVFHDWRT